MLPEKMQASASWYGFNFLDITLDNVKAMTQAEIQERQKNAQPNAGIINHKFIVRTGNPDQADADYLTISTNKGSKPAVLKEISTGKANIKFHKATWEQLPTMVHIVNKLAELEVKEIYDGLIVKNSGGSMGVTLVLE
jgi:hypothetical protein